MMEEARVFVPLRKDLLIRELKDEVLLYDKTTKKAHCLNDTAAAVWRLCDGQRNVRQIACALEQSEEVVWIALEELENCGVLNGEFPSTIRGLSRRELMTKIGIGAAISLPIVSSILVPTASAAPSPAKKQPQRRIRHGN